MKNIKKIIALILSIIIVGISIGVIINGMPSMTAKNKMKEALESKDFGYVQSVYTEYFFLDEPQNVQTKNYGDVTVTTSGFLVSDEMNAVSNVLVDYFESVYSTVENYYLDDMTTIYDNLRLECGNIIVGEENTFNIIWESSAGSYYVLDNVEEAYNRLISLCTGIEYDEYSGNNIQNILYSYDVECEPFSDGYAFCSTDDTESKTLYVIDKQGRIVGQTQDESIAKTNLGYFNNGFALLKNVSLYDKTQESKLVNKNLEVVLSAPNEKFSDMLGRTEDNVILVMKKTNTIDGSSIQLGAVDTSGNFVTKLRESGISISTEETIITASYWGEGVFCVQGEYDLSSSHSRHFTNAVLFNVNTGEVFNMSSYGFKPDWLQYRSISGRFVNGKALIATTPPLYKSIKDMYLINSDFEITPVVKECSFDDFSCYSKNGYFYCDTSSVLEDRYGYYDENFEMKIDLSKYNVLSVSSFVDGCAVLMIANPDGVKFVVAIDEKGNNIFDPIEVEDAAGSYSEGLLALDLGDNNITYIDRNGEVRFTIPMSGYSLESSIVKCSDGIVTNGSAYYDLSGNMLFN